MAETVASPSSTASTLEGQDVFAHTNDEIQSIVKTDTFNEAEKKVLALNELAKAIGVQPKALERSIPGLDSLYNVAQAAYDDILAFANDPVKLKKVIAYRIQQLKKDPYVVSIHGDAEASPEDKLLSTSFVAPVKEATTDIAAKPVEAGVDKATVVDEKKSDELVEAKAESPELKLVRLEKELKDAYRMADTNEDKAAKYDLITNPQLLPKYLSMKWLDCRIASKGRSPLNLLYRYPVGKSTERRRRFTRPKYKINHIPDTYADLKNQFGEEAQNAETNAYTRKVMRHRRELIKHAYEMVRHMKVIEKGDYKTIPSRVGKK